MKQKISNKVCIEFTLDSSEALMFTKGGKHKVNLKGDELTQFVERLENADEVEISMQMDRFEQTRYDHVTQHAISSGGLWNTGIK